MSFIYIPIIANNSMSGINTVQYKLLYSRYLPTINTVEKEKKKPRTWSGLFYNTKFIIRK